MIDIFVEAINAVQQATSKVGDRREGTLNAPPRENYPEHIDTLSLPIALTTIMPRSLIPLLSPSMPATLNMRTIIYVEAWNQGLFSEIQLRCIRIAGDWWSKFRAEETYLYNDAEKKYLVNHNGVQVYVQAKGQESFSGYVVRQYPERTDNQYHAIEMNFQIGVQDANCED